MKKNMVNYRAFAPLLRCYAWKIYGLGFGTCFNPPQQNQVKIRVAYHGTSTKVDTFLVATLKGNPGQPCPTSIFTLKPCSQQWHKDCWSTKGLHHGRWNLTSRLRRKILQLIARHTVDGKNPANQLRLVILSHCLQGSCTSNRWLGMGFLKHQLYFCCLGRSDGKCFGFRNRTQCSRIDVDTPKAQEMIMCQVKAISQAITRNKVYVKV